MPNKWWHMPTKRPAISTKTTRKCRFSHSKCSMQEHIVHRASEWIRTLRICGTYISWCAGKLQPLDRYDSLDSSIDVKQRNCLIIKIMKNAQISHTYIWKMNDICAISQESSTQETLWIYREKKKQNKYHIVSRNTKSMQNNLRQWIECWQWHWSNSKFRTQNNRMSSRCGCVNFPICNSRVAFVGWHVLLAAMQTYHGYLVRSNWLCHLRYFSRCNGARRRDNPAYQMNCKFIKQIWQFGNLLIFSWNLNFQRAFKAIEWDEQNLHTWKKRTKGTHW